MVTFWSSSRAMLLGFLSVVMPYLCVVELRFDEVNSVLRGVQIWDEAVCLHCNDFCPLFLSKLFCLFPPFILLGQRTRWSYSTASLSSCMCLLDSWMPWKCCDWPNTLDKLQNYVNYLDLFLENCNNYFLIKKYMYRWTHTYGNFTVFISKLKHYYDHSKIKTWIIFTNIKTNETNSI